LVKSDQSVLTKIIQLVQQGYLNPYISNRFSFEDFKKGAEIIASGHAVGKCIITIQDGVK
jgi:NADPH:quinone reductase-like Zn-dependent oxidoreductase